MKFLSIGECMLELAPHGDTLFAASFAGDTFNTAWYMARLAGDAVSVSYLTAVGDDAASAQMTSFMTAAGVTPLVKIRPGRSIGLYMITLTKGERSFMYWRDTSAARTLADDLEDLPLSAGDVAYFSGITLAILPPEGRERLLTALTACRRRGVQIAFDPNLRPRLWPNAADMRHWIMLGAAVSDLCLPSHEDEAQWFKDDSPGATCARYADAGARLVVVKNGADTIALLKDDKLITVPVSPAPTVVDTTAAGDSFNAVFCLKHMCGYPPDQAAAAAARFASSVIAHPGALVDVTLA